MRLTIRYNAADEHAHMACAGACANDAEMCGICPEFDKIIDRLAAYEDTGLSPEEAARAIVPPCKPTDTIYVIQSYYRGKKKIKDEIEAAQIDRFIIGEAGILVADICTDGGSWYEAMEPKDYYLTREEAEAALAKEAGNG